MFETIVGSYIFNFYQLLICKFYSILLSELKL